MKKGKKLFYFISLFFLLLGANFVWALEIDYPRIPGATAPQDFIGTASGGEAISLYVRYLFVLIVWVSGIILLGSIIYGGILYLISSGDAAKLKNARDQMTASFLGIIILFSSYIIFSIINPQIISLEIPEPTPVKQIVKREVPLPETEYPWTLIYTELPLGQIIEKGIFETKVSPGETRKPRMDRIKDVAKTTLNIAGEIKKLNNDLKNETNKCSCDQTEALCPGCSPDRCTSDPCQENRSKIVNIETKNNEKLSELFEEQKKTIEEVKALKEELDKLNRVESFMEDCPLISVTSLADFQYQKDIHLEQKWVTRQLPFWEQIKIDEDWATLYCLSSGTLLSQTPAITSAGLEPMEFEIPEITPVEMGCTIRIPVGEIIDRTQRISEILIERLETLVTLDREMEAAVDQMHVLVSQCSSVRCTPICIDTGWGGCFKFCMGIPCPVGQIGNQAEEIAQIQENIKKVVEETNEEEMGIVPIINDVVPKILEDLDKILRKELKTCINEFPVEVEEEKDIGPLIMLSVCENALRGVGPNNKIIRKCCFGEPEFQDCLGKCYLKKGGKEYRKCLDECLEQKGGEIANCHHQTNFFCCGK